MWFQRRCESLKIFTVQYTHIKSGIRYTEEPLVRCEDKRGHTGEHYGNAGSSYEPAYRTWEF